MKIKLLKYIKVALVFIVFISLVTLVLYELINAVRDCSTRIRVAKEEKRLTAHAAKIEYWSSVRDIVDAMSVDSFGSRYKVNKCLGDSDGSIAFLIISPGKDGVFGSNYEDYLSASGHRYNDDISLMVLYFDQDTKYIEINYNSKYYCSKSYFSDTLCEFVNDNTPSKYRVNTNLEYEITK